MSFFIDKIKEVKFKSKFDVVSLICMTLILTTFGINKYIDFVYTMMMAIILLFHFKEDNFLYLYIMFYVYQDVLNVPFLPISMIRIYQLIYIFRLCYKVIKKEIKLENNRKTNIVFLIFFLSIFMYQDDLSVIISLAIFQIPLIYELMIVLKDKNKRNQFYLTIVFIAICSALWGVIVGGSNSLNINEGIVRRGSTFVNPNLSALTYLLGLIALLGVNFKGKMNYLKYFLFLILTILLLSTGSMTGILIFGLAMFVYMFIYYRKLCIVFVVVAVIGVIVIMNVSISNNIVMSLQHRISRVLTAIQSGDMEMLTSNRFYLITTYMDYFAELPIPNMLFGTFNTTSGYFSEWFMDAFKVMNSHNFLIDVLFGNGIIGCIMVIGAFVYTLKKHVSNFIKKKDVSDFAMIALKMVVILFALSTYVYPSIVFYIFFLI